ncbi:MAG: GNAT family N-acetyltransferase [Candidatus Tectomicrobia bacterium]|uniref:GNAT family N-acetyltransferase n=1 Tax=Tectimicrobiota bacterium TaxID=2528274 RepID=A0A932HVZ0_UNCTE|nr:GNAT family N-acetyltransferase [Candidatus Tectomicrobia bacterium]
MSEAGIRLRPAGPADSRLLWELRNEDSVRRASFHPKAIPIEEHERWFARKMGDARFRAFVAVDPAGKDVGYVRFDLDGEEAEISVAIDKGERGKGYGLAAIRAGSERMLAEGPARRVIALVRRDNPASLAAFERAGYRAAGGKSLQGVEGIVLVFGDGG